MSKFVLESIQHLPNIGASIIPKYVTSKTAMNIFLKKKQCHSKIVPNDSPNGLHEWTKLLPGPWWHPHPVVLPRGVGYPGSLNLVLEGGDCRKTPPLLTRPRNPDWPGWPG